VEAYQRERVDRFAKGELTSADSVHLQDTVKYYTVNKRVVHGGGGIMPDVFVPIDTTQSSEYFSRLVRNGILNTFALTHVDANRNTLLAQYPDPETFRRKFVVDEKLLGRLQQAAELEGIAFDSVGMQRSKDLISLRLKALIARDLWDTSAYWQMINAENSVDRSFQKALEALQDNTFQRLGMAR
jgi:carboxyl-terminal processing protease